jgi:hypothetical protein
MADIKFLNNISLENLQLNNAKLQVVASDPVLSGADYEGRVIYNSTDNSIKFHNGADTNYWVKLDGSGDISSVAVRAGEGLEVEAGADSAVEGAFDVTLGLASSVSGGGLAYDAGVISVNDDNSTLTIVEDVLKIKDGGVTGTQIGADAVDGTKIADDSIDSEHYVDGSIDSAHLAADSVDGTKIADDAINSEHYTDGSIDLVHLAADSVDGTKIADNSINSEHYIDGSIDNAHIAADAVDGTKIADNSINSEHYVDGSVDNEHLANDGIIIGTTDVSLGDTVTALVGLTDLDLTAAAHTIFDTVGENNLTMGASTTTVIIPGDLQVTGTVTTNNVETVSTTNGVVFEGTTADEHEGTLLAGALTADRTYTLPDATGTVALTDDISDATITITAGAGLITGGSFTLNQSSDATITINHEDTSSQTSVDNSGLSVIQDVALDTYGHTTGLTSVDLTAGVDGRITAREYSGLIGDGAASTLVLKDTGAAGTAQSNHALGADSSSFMVQLIEVSSGATVFADVERAAAGVVNIIFASAPASNAIRVLITKIG